MLLEDQLVPTQLFLVQLPFAGDVRQLAMPSLPETNNEEKSNACDELIDALMLPDDVLRSDTVPNPGIRSFRKTVVSKAVDPDSRVVPARGKDRKTENIFLPFEGDRGLSLILSKAFLLAEDDKITDTTILSQIGK